jgi:hypothetical protein
MILSEFVTKGEGGYNCRTNYNGERDEDALTKFSHAGAARSIQHGRSAKRLLLKGTVGTVSCG